MVTVVLTSSVECRGSYSQTSCSDATIEAVVCVNQLSRMVVSPDLPLNQRQSTCQFRTPLLLSFNFAQNTLTADTVAETSAAPTFPTSVVHIHLVSPDD